MMKFYSTVEKEMENLNEGLITSTFTTASALYIAKMLMTKWTNWPAFSLGLIDEKGTRTDKKAETSEEKESLNLLNSFIMSLRRIFLFFVSENILKVLVSIYIIKAVIRK